MRVPTALCMAAACALLSGVDGFKNPRGRRGALSDHIDEHDLVHIDLNHLADQHARVRRSNGDHTFQVDFPAFGNKFKLRMRQSKNLFAPTLQVNVVSPDGQVDVHHIDQTAWFRGRLLSGPGASSSVVRAHKTEDGLHGTIHVDGELFRFEPLNRSDARQARSPAGFNHVIYAHRHTRNHEKSQGTCGFNDEDFGLHDHDHSRRDVHDHDHDHDDHDHDHDHDHGDHQSRDRRAVSTVDYGNNTVPVATICQMHLVADHKYFQYKGSSVPAASNSMVEFLDDVNSKYVTAGLDDTIANPLNPTLHMYNNRLQFSVAQVTVFTSNAGIKEADGSVRVEYPWKELGDTDDSADFLNHFTFANGFTKKGAVSELLQTNSPDICLSHAFTHQDFKGGVLGLAWLGTVCADTRSTGITTTINYATEPVYTQNMLVVAHEIGHNVGMEHDQKGCSKFCSTTLNDKACGLGKKCCAANMAEFVGDASGGKYAMWPVSVDGGNTNNYQFSACSRYLTNQKLVVGGADKCLTLPQAAVCGNGLVEDGEECDCGVANGINKSPSDPTWDQDLTYCQTADANFNKDECCTPNCQLDKNGARPDGPAECSPKKGMCCGSTPGKECKFLGFEKSEIDPATLQPTAQAKIDKADDLEEWACRAATDCTETVYCTQDETYVGECPYTALASNEDTVDDLPKFWKPDATLCDTASKTCQSGYCNGDLCLAYEYTNPDGELVTPTMCTVPGDDFLACVITCDFYGNGSCIATTLLNQSGFDLTWVPAGMPEDGAIKSANSLCNNNEGTCSELGACITPSTASPTDILNNLLDSLISDAWVWENWYFVLAFESAIAMIAFLLRCGKKGTDETKDFVKNRLRGDEFSKTIKRRAFESVRGSKKKKKRKSQGMTLRNIAVLEAEGEQLRRTSEIFGGEKRKDLAFFRLRVLFPFSKQEVIRKIISLSPHEECAVARLLVLGHAMWEVTDYKLLNYQAKKNKKMGNVKRLKDRSVRYPGGRGGGRGGGGGGGRGGGSRGGGSRGGGGGSRAGGGGGGGRPSNGRGGGSRGGGR